ncbi:MAG: hypothetical protein WDZ63_13285 [Burkholderiales bacterium]
METISLKWHGPFSFVAGDAPLIYGAPEANKPGVYLWTVPFEGRNYINYVGIGVWNVAARNDEHMRCYLSGKYTFYKAMPFARLEKQVAFDAGHGLEAFLARYDDNVHDLMNSLKVWTKGTFMLSSIGAVVPSRLPSRSRSSNLRGEDDAL